MELFVNRPRLGARTSTGQEIWISVQTRELLPPTSLACMGWLSFPLGEAKLHMTPTLWASWKGQPLRQYLKEVLGGTELGRQVGS